MLQENLTAVIFGGTGFIGRYVVQRLSQAGYTIRIPTRHPSAAHLLQPNGRVAQIVPFPFKDTASINAAIQGTSVVINLLGVLSEKKRGDFQHIHVDIAGEIAAIAKNSGVKRLVHISALGANENSPSDYARTKALGEKAVLSAFPTATIFQPSLVFGPEDLFFNRFASLVRFMPFIPLINNGTTRFQPVYVGDVAEGIKRALQNSESSGKIYTAVGPQIFTFRQLMEHILKTINRKRLLISIPEWLASISASLLERLSGQPLLTRDQIRLLQYNNIATADDNTLTAFGMSPQPLDVILPRYLERFRKKS